MCCNRKIEGITICAKCGGELVFFDKTMIGGSDRSYVYVCTDCNHTNDVFGNTVSSGDATKQKGGI